MVAVAQDVAREYATLDMKAHAATKARLREEMLPRLRALIDKEFPS